MQQEGGRDRAVERQSLRVRVGDKCPRVGYREGNAVAGAFGNVVDPIRPEERDLVLLADVLVEFEAGKRSGRSDLIDYREIVDVAGAGRHGNQVLYLQGNWIETALRNHVAGKLRTRGLAVDHLITER